VTNLGSYVAIHDTMSTADGLASVQDYRDLLDHHLAKIDQVKQDVGIEPCLTEAECVDVVMDVEHKAAMRSTEHNKKAHYALVETVFRGKFYSLLEAESIDKPSFTKVWNLLDVVAILSDHELCEPGLIFWLVEELLDIQVIDGCRKVFDYLESRRERITAVSGSKTSSQQKANQCRNISRRRN
jgi:THO complex subunit 1